MDNNTVKRMMTYNNGHWWFESRKKIFHELLKNLNLKKKQKF